MQDQPDEILIPVEGIGPADYYAAGVFAHLQASQECELTEDYSEHILAISFLERAAAAELNDPDPIDQEIGIDEPNWLRRLDEPERFDPYGTAPDSTQA